MNPLRRVRLVGLALLASALLAGLLIPAAQAHALLVRSVPEADAELVQPPAQIELWFSEPLEAEFSTARLLDSSGAELPRGALLFDPADPAHLTLPLNPLAPGVYTVVWQTFSQVDGHEFTGAFPITVLNPDGTRPADIPAEGAGTGRSELPTPAETLARWSWLLGGLLFFGVSFFQLVILPAARATNRQTAELIESSGQAAGLRLLWLGVLLVTFGQGWQLILSADSLGDAAGAVNVLLGTRLGAVLLARQALALALLFASLRLPQPEPVAKNELVMLYATGAGTGIALGLLLARGGETSLSGLTLGAVGLSLGWTIWQTMRSQPAPAKSTWRLILGLAGGWLLAVSLVSHAGAGGGSRWAVLVDFIHLLAAGVWLGGLLLLAGLLWQTRRLATEQRSAYHQSLVKVVRRFSYLASLAVFVLALSGLFSSLVELSSPADLWLTAYGRVLLVKLGLVGLALGVALLNNRLVHARRAISPDLPVMPRLRWQVSLEGVLALGLLLSVAVLVQTPVPRPAAPQAPSLPFTSVISGGDLSMHIQVDPNQAGSNRFWLHLYHPDGSPIGEVQLVQLRFSFRDLPLGQAKMDLEAQGRNTYAAEGAYLSQAGEWDLSVYIRRRGLDDSLLTFSLAVPPPVSLANSARPWDNPVANLPAPALLLVGLVSLGAIPLVWRRPLQAIWPRAYRGLVAAAYWLALPGSLLSLGWLMVVLLAPPAATLTENPIPVSAESLSQGQALYVDNCLPCHGVSGAGDGPAALALNPRPANLLVHVVPGLHSDYQLFEWITNGFPGTAMPAFDTLLTADQRWHIVNYIRSLPDR